MANGNACANSAATPQLGDPERYIPYSGVAHIVGLAYAAGVKIHPASAQAALLGMASNIAVVGKLLALSEPPSLNERDVAAIADLFITLGETTQALLSNYVLADWSPPGTAR
jgi:hypothetical protein